MTKQAKMPKRMTNRKRTKVPKRAMTIDNPLPRTDLGDPLEAKVAKEKARGGEKVLGTKTMVVGITISGMIGMVEIGKIPGKTGMDDKMIIGRSPEKVAGNYQIWDDLQDA